METNHQGDDAQTPETTATNIGYDDFFQTRLKAAEIPEGDPPEEATETIPDPVEQEPEAEGEPAEEEGIAEEPEAEFDPEVVLSQFEQLSPEERKKVQSRAVARYGELTARAKQSEAEAYRLKQQLAEKEAANPFEAPAVENNPFQDLNTQEELASQAKNLQAVEEWADNLLWEHSNADPDDVIVTEDGKDMTKKDVREYQLNARKGIKTFLPDRLKAIQRTEYAKMEKAAVDKATAEQLEWMQDEENPTYGAYQKTISDPIIDEIREKVPSVAPRLDAIIAHAVNSMAGLQAKPKGKPTASKTKATKPRAKPPSNPPSNASTRMPSSDENLSKQIKEMQQRYQETGDIDDWKRLRVLQHQS